MAQIDVNDLTFYYEDSFENVFEHVTFSIDTNWKLGFVGRNGKGKTTFLHLLMGKYEYRGSIRSNTSFDYFPYHIEPEYFDCPAAEFIDKLKCGCEQWRVICELEQLGLDAEVLYRPFGTLSFGERTKVMLAVLFSGENDFLLIDEPTNHLDWQARELVKKYLQGKKGFILTSHDRDLLDACIDHILVLNRCTIEVQSGSFSSWWENKSRKDNFARVQNEKHRKEIAKLREAARRTGQWADKSEASKIGYDPIKEHDHNVVSGRGYIGAKTKKMQSRVKQMERRMEQEIKEKEGLLQDIENPSDLKLVSLRHHKNLLLSAREYGLGYAGAGTFLFEGLNFEICQRERVFLCGANGCGKTSLIQAVLQEVEGEVCGTEQMELMEQGMLQTASGLIVSYVSQDTSFLRGSIKEFGRVRNLEESLFFALLHKMDVERSQFDKNMENFSEGQKKKVLLAASLVTPAHLYIWDEPLNYIDVFSRIQLENVLLSYQPTMLVVEHDVKFKEHIATKVIEIKKGCNTCKEK
ncbi:MAG: ATP-binding cassette domain-containing protein [Lachnospiraceae bacterium]|nr:ATP-binding cassette domain-containing protein [Lachnospiraceae bacterium]